MRVLILGEGPSDLGRVEPDGTLQLEGALPTLVRRLLNERAPGAPVEIRAREIRKLRRFPESTRGIRPSQYGYAKKLAALPGLREGREADAIVAVVDRDGKRHKDRIEELNKGRDELRQANKRCAVGVAIEMIEAWLLADEEALRTALNDRGIQRQPDPETLASRDEQSDQNPKGRLQRLMEQSVGREIGRADFPVYYAQIASNLGLDVLEQRCSDGFKPFANQVRELLSS